MREQVFFFSVFTDRFIFRHILGPFFYAKMEYPPGYERIRSIKIIKKNENVASLSENAKIIIFFRSVDFADWFVGLKRYSKLAPKPF